MLTKENSADGTGAASAGSAFKKENENGHCNICGHDLLELTSFARYIVHVCDNIHCDRFHAPQRYTKKPDPKPLVVKPSIACTRPSYLHYKEQKRENYHLIRSYGVASVEAANMCSNKQTRLFLESRAHENN